MMPQLPLVPRLFAALMACLLAGPGSVAIAAPGSVVSQDLPLDMLPSVDVVILGEVHDNPQHHSNQALGVEALAPAALVFEMLTVEQAARATPELRQDAAALGEALEWEASGWPDFRDYYPIFAAAPEAQIHGGGLDRAEVRGVFDRSAAEVFGPEAARFGLDQPLAQDEQEAREALQQRAHCDALPPEMLPGMVAAQRLRDAALSRAVIAAHEATGGPVVLIAGSGHARADWGVPALLALAAPELSVFSVGQSESAPEGDVPYDLLVVTDPAPRSDPCEAFR